MESEEQKLFLELQSLIQAPQPFFGVGRPSSNVRKLDIILSIEVERQSGLHVTALLLLDFWIITSLEEDLSIDVPPESPVTVEGLKMRVDSIQNALGTPRNIPRSLSARLRNYRLPAAGRTLHDARHLLLDIGRFITIHPLTLTLPDTKFTQVARGYYLHKMRDLGATLQDSCNDEQLCGALRELLVREYQRAFNMPTHIPPWHSFSRLSPLDTRPAEWESQNGDNDTVESSDGSNAHQSDEKCTLVSPLPPPPPPPPPSIELQIVILPPGSANIDHIGKVIGAPDGLTTSDTLSADVNGGKIGTESSDSFVVT